MSHTWPDVLSTLVAGDDLTTEQARWAMDEVFAGAATPVQLAGLVVALRAKGETVDEVTGIADAMLAAANPISVPGRLLDVVGTGGDRSMSVNISTMSAIVAAGAGARVVKHGNRSASSKSGSADVLEALGIRLDLPPARVAEVADEAGITFCFSAAFHPAMRHAAVPRRELGIATTFNILGPLTNPARPQAQAIGCADARMAPVMAGVLAGRGVDAWVFRGDDGLDELTTTTTSTLWRVHDGAVTESSVDPASLGIARATTEDLRGGDAAHNADVVRRLLAGEQGPVRDAVVLNAGAALAVYDSPDARRRLLARRRGDEGRRGDRLGCGAGRARAVGGGDLRLSSELEDVGLALAPEAEPVVVGADHSRRCHHAAEPAVGEQAALAPHELAGGEVAVARRDVVEQHVRRVARSRAGARRPRSRRPSARGTRPGRRTGSWTNVGLNFRMSAPCTRRVWRRYSSSGPTSSTSKAVSSWRSRRSRTMNQTLMATSTVFMPTIGHTSSAALNTIRMTHAIALSTRRRRTLACSRE